MKTPSLRALSSAATLITGLLVMTVVSLSFVFLIGNQLIEAQKSRALAESQNALDSYAALGEQTLRQLAQALESEYERTRLLGLDPAKSLEEIAARLDDRRFLGFGLYDAKGVTLAERHYLFSGDLGTNALEIDDSQLQNALALKSYSGADTIWVSSLYRQGDTTRYSFYLGFITKEEGKAENSPALFLAEIDAGRFLIHITPGLTPKSGALEVYGPGGVVLAHPNPSYIGQKASEVYAQDPAWKTLLEGELSAANTAKSRSGDTEGALYASRLITNGQLAMRLIIRLDEARLVEPIVLAERMLVLASLFLLGLGLFLGYFWSRAKARELEADLQIDNSAELDKMVEARTVELNFVTRTIKDLIDSIPSALIVLDRNLDVLLVNLSFYSIFSSRLVNVTGRNISEVFDETIHDRLRKSMNTKEPILDVEIRKPLDGRGEKVLMLSALHLLGKRDRLLLVIDDISERKILERQLIQAEKMAGLGTLMTGVAHEINNPLNAIAGMAQIIAAHTGEEETRADVQQIQHYVKRVAEIVKELSRYSRSSKVVETASTDIHAVLEGAITMVQHSRRLDDVTISRNYAQNLPLLKINVGDMEQVFVNLLSNAIDALDEAQTKRGPSFKKRIHLSTSLHDSEHAQVEIEDNGPGISAQNLQLIFDPFFSTKEPGKGTGLGLSICYKIAQRYGGIILVESQEGHKTRFIVRLPIQSSKTE